MESVPYGRTSSYPDSAPCEIRKYNQCENAFVKPRILYHGSSTGGIEILEPMNRSHPLIEPDAPPSVYASDDPGYSAGFGFPWGTGDGFALRFTKTTSEQWRPILEVPKSEEYRIDQPVYVYAVPSDSFKLLVHVQPGEHNYRSLVSVKPLYVERYVSVRQAMEQNNGIVRVYEPEL